MSLLFRCLGTIAVLVFLLPISLAQESEPDTDEQTEHDAEISRTGSKSGFDDIPERGGPESVGTRLKENDVEKESIYQFQLSMNFSLTPNLQVIFDPAGNPSENSIWVFGLRAALTL